MTRRFVLQCALIFILAAVQTVHTFVQSPPPRLIADNRTPYTVDVYAWNGAAWGFVTRLGPSSWTAFPNALNGSYWRAVFGQQHRDHRVQYRYEPSYGGYQDVFLIR
jgi:hypothetical protein